MAQDPIEVQGLAVLIKDFKAIDKALPKAVTKALKKSAEPAAAEGERLVLGGIRNMPASPRWAGMRIGVSAKLGQVYMVPQAKRAGGSGRAKLKQFMGPLMELAVENKAADIEDAIGDAIEHLADSHGF